MQSKKKSTAQEITPIKAEAGQNNKRGRKGGCRKGMHEYESTGRGFVQAGGGRKGKEGRRRHVCRSMIYRLHCRHGDFCQPSLQSKVVVQTAVPQSEGEGQWGERGMVGSSVYLFLWRVGSKPGMGKVEEEEEMRMEGVLTKLPSSACAPAVSAPRGGSRLM